MVSITPVSYQLSSSWSSAGTGMGAAATGSSSAPARTVTCSSLGVSSAPSEAGSSQSTSSIGAKNLSRSSKRSRSPVALVVRHLDLLEFLFLVARTSSTSATSWSVSLWSSFSDALQVIFRDLVLVLKPLERLLRVPPDVADGDPGLLGPLVHDLDQLLATLLGERREREADHVAVVRRREAEVAGMIAFSIAPMAFLSNGWITSRRGSGTENEASWLSGVAVP